MPGRPGTVVDVIHDETTRIRTGLVSLYGAVAAVVRGDTEGARLMLSDLEETVDDLTEILVAISIASLERLHVATQAAPVPVGASRTLAADLIERASSFEVSTIRSVHGAAWRLDAVRRGDREGAVSDVEQAAADSSPAELMFGATALLAAIVALWAKASGLSERRAATDLCLAASFDPRG